MRALAGNEPPAALYLELGEPIGGIWRLWRAFYPARTLPVVDGPHGYAPTPISGLLRRDAFELSRAKHLPYTSGGELEDLGGLTDAVEVPVHTGMLGDLEGTRRALDGVRVTLKKPGRV